MENSILISTKKNLGVDQDYNHFDLDIITHINSVLNTVTQLGVGPDTGYMIEDMAATWADFVGDDKRLNMVRSYVYLKVRMLFDPPATSFLLAAFKEQIQELEWRININQENKGNALTPAPTPEPTPTPTPTPTPDPTDHGDHIHYEDVIDGGVIT